ncbi:MAG: dienelactone hydrolase family protein [Candidatus Lindowbacteria bacterium]|nr:dienelactone hydrolase family protein [Candidatus Lindowbacteria bacterium]
MDSGDGAIIEELFKYDKDLPLDAVGQIRAFQPDVSIEYHVTFTSAHDQRVPSLLTLPLHSSPPHPVVLILHGVFGHKTSVNQIKRSAFLAKAGYATLRIDGQYSGERALPSRTGIGLQAQYCYRNRDAMIQTAVDLMRAVDYLATRNDIDVRRIGFAGFSMGGAVGALFCAHEARVKAAVLGITGGDFTKLSIRASDKSAEERFRRAYRIVDPARHISRISPRPLLMLNASRDEVVPKAATEALFEAAGEPKRIVWYDCGHADLPDELLEEMKRFYDSELQGGERGVRTEGEKGN